MVKVSQDFALGLWDMIIHRYLMCIIYFLNLHVMGTSIQLHDTASTHMHTQLQHLQSDYSYDSLFLYEGSRSDGFHFQYSEGNPEECHQFLAQRKQILEH